MICNRNNRKISYTLEKYNDTDKPLIINAKWGVIEISYLGEKIKYKDAIIWPSGYEPWDWSKSNTHHNPGIQLFDVKKLIRIHKCDYIILSTGFENILQVDNKTIKWLVKHDVKYIILNSLDAIIEYNNTDKKAGILLHSTC